MFWMSCYVSSIVISLVLGGALHLLLMIAHGLVKVAIGREGHTSSLIAARDFFIWLLLIVVKVAILPMLSSALLLGALYVLRSGLLPTSMLGLVHAGGSRLIPTYIVGEGRSLLTRIIAMVPRLRVVHQSCRGTPRRGCLLDL